MTKSPPGLVRLGTIGFSWAVPLLLAIVKTDARGVGWIAKGLPLCWFRQSGGFASWPFPK